MNHEVYIKLAKADDTTQFNKATWYEALESYAESIRKKDETPEAAFARAIETDDGNLLYQRYRTAEGPSVKKSAEDPQEAFDKRHNTSSWGKIVERAKKLQIQQRERKLTIEQAISEVLAMQEGGQLHQQYLQEVANNS